MVVVFWCDSIREMTVRWMPTGQSEFRMQNYGPIWPNTKNLGKPRSKMAAVHDPRSTKMSASLIIDGRSLLQDGPRSEPLVIGCHPFQCPTDIKIAASKVQCPIDLAFVDAWYNYKNKCPKRSQWSHCQQRSFLLVSHQSTAWARLDSPTQVNVLRVYPHTNTARRTCRKAIGKTTWKTHQKKMNHHLRVYPHTNTARRTCRMAIGKTTLHRDEMEDARCTCRRRGGQHMRRCLAHGGS